MPELACHVRALQLRFKPGRLACFEGLSSSAHTMTCVPSCKEASSSKAYGTSTPLLVSDDYAPCIMTISMSRSTKRLARNQLRSCKGRVQQLPAERAGLVLEPFLWPEIQVTAGGRRRPRWTYGRHTIAWLG